MGHSFYTSTLQTAFNLKLESLGWPSLKTWMQIYEVFLIFKLNCITYSTWTHLIFSTSVLLGFSFHLNTCFANQCYHFCHSNFIRWNSRSISNALISACQWIAQDFELFFTGFTHSPTLNLPEAFSRPKKDAMLFKSSQK